MVRDFRRERRVVFDARTLKDIYRGPPAHICDFFKKVHLRSWVPMDGA